MSLKRSKENSAKFLYKRLSNRQLVANELAEGAFGKSLDVAQGVLSIFAVILYVYATYQVTSDHFYIMN